MIRYSFKSDEPLTIKAAAKASAQKLGEALALVAEKSSGHLVPKAVVEAARDKKSPLHKHFEWDNQIAADKFRLDQARSLIRSIHVENSDAENGLARAFLSIREKSGVSYRSLDDVLRSADLQQKVLAAAERDLVSFEARYRTLEDICAIIKTAREQIAVRRSATGHDNRVSL